MAKGWLFLGRNKQSKTEAVNVDNGALEVKTVGNIVLKEWIDTIRIGGFRRWHGENQWGGAEVIPVNTLKVQDISVWYKNKMTVSATLEIYRCPRSTNANDSEQIGENISVPAGAEIWVTSSEIPALAKPMQGIAVALRGSTEDVDKFDLVFMGR